MFKRWDKEMTDNAVKRKDWVHYRHASRHVHLLHWHFNPKNVSVSLNYQLSLRMERFVSGAPQSTEQLCPRYRHKSVSGSRVGHKSLSFPSTGQKSARQLGDFQPAYIMRLAFNIIHLSVYILIFRHAYWREAKVICTYGSFNVKWIFHWIFYYCWNYTFLRLKLVKKI